MNKRVSRDSSVNGTRRPGFASAAAVLLSWGVLTFAVGCDQQSSSSSPNVQPAASTSTAQTSPAVSTNAADQASSPTGTHPATGTQAPSATPTPVPNPVTGTTPPQPGTAPPTATPPAATPAQIANGPKIVFEVESHDFGKLISDEKVNFAFKFRNEGKAPLVISNVQSSCGCTAAKPSKPQFEPGESGEIQVTYDPKGRSGVQAKDITVVCNDPSRPSFSLKITADVWPLIKVMPPSLSFGNIKAGDRPQLRLTVTSLDKDVQVKDVLFKGRGLAFKVVDSPIPSADPNYPGQKIVEISLTDEVPTGQFNQKFDVVTLARSNPSSEPVETYHNIQMYGMISGDIEVTPTYMSAGAVVINQDFSTEVTLTSKSGQAFNLIGEPKIIDIVTLQREQVKVTAEPFEADGKKGWKVVLSGNPGSFNGPFTGTIEVETDLPKEKYVHFTFHGLVQIAPGQFPGGNVKTITPTTQQSLSNVNPANTQPPATQPGEKAPQ